MKRFACLLLLAAMVAHLLGGCGKSDNTPISAREKRVLPPAPSTIEVTRWKQTDGKDKVYGMVIEQDGLKTSANLYTLEPGEGLVIREREAKGKFFPDLQALVFPLYNPTNIAVEDWIKTGGPHVVIPWHPAANHLVGTLNQPGKSNLYNFTKLEGVAPTYPTGSAPK